VTAKSVGRSEGDQDGTEREQDTRNRLPPGTVRCENHQYREIRGHGEVFEHEYGQHCGGFPIAEPAKIAEQAGDDPRRGDVGNTRERQDAYAVEAE
jgi:hypothetical protein